MQIITVIAQKGGTGKTTTAAAIAQAAQLDGKRVLAIDLDPQADLTRILGCQADVMGSYAVIMGDTIKDRIITSPQGMDLLPASPGLILVETSQGSARRLQKALKAVKSDYDIIIIDPPGSNTELQYNAIQAATDVIITLLSDSLGCETLTRTSGFIDPMRKTNRSLKNIGYLLTLYDGRSTLSKQFKDAIIEQGEGLGLDFLGCIRPSIVVREAQALRENLYTYAPKKKPTEDYRALYDVIAKDKE